MEREPRLGVRIAKGALKDLRVRNNADPNAFASRFPQGIPRVRIAAGNGDQHVGVEVILNGRSIARAPSSRQR